MKVFISWSGAKSHKVALAFRDWLPSVIQSIEPYVSSEDIDKGTRWSTDIAKELQDSTFGILCVTRENLEAPWLSFEAGALSKTIDKSFVTPFLFDIKRSEVKGPILQFQSTIFAKDDIKKLLTTLNKACGETNIPESRLNEAFEVWFPKLEEKLNPIKDIKEEASKGKEVATPKTAEILEEILDLSRNNQILLRNPDIKDSIEELKKVTHDHMMKFERNSDYDKRRLSRKVRPMFMEELMHIGMREGKNSYGFLIALSLFKDDFPWIYDAGKELLDILKSEESMEARHEAVRDFNEMIEFTLHHPMMREIYGGRNEAMMYMKEMPYILMKFTERLFEREMSRQE